ncbi:unnamed protein product [Heligmosomoides polygyrus]|uniref:DSBA domain-containing protein n=1 Tax=Heligmosomoides polygyrus TaxID=6339 RepID=A0A3P8ESP1_HELPZ|nr:unnamed protein product [Heligmosomoides polygyrus]
MVAGKVKIDLFYDVISPYSWIAFEGIGRRSQSCFVFATGHWVVQKMAKNDIASVRTEMAKVTLGMALSCSEPDLQSADKRSMLWGDGLIRHDLRVFDNASVAMLHKDEVYLRFGIPAMIRNEALLRYQRVWPIEVVLRPFALGKIMRSSGNRPPGVLPAKATYMLKDLQRNNEFWGMKLSPPKDFMKWVRTESSANAMKLLVAVQSEQPEDESPSSRNNRPESEEATRMEDEVTPSSYDDRPHSECCCIPC